MKESTQYLHFFQKNIVIFLVFIFIGLVAGFIYNSQVPAEYTTTRLYEFSYTSENVSTKAIEADQAVALLRSPNIQKQLGISIGSLVVYNSGPLSLHVETIAATPEDSLLLQQKAQQFLETKFQLHQIGSEQSFVNTPKIFFHILFSVAIAFFTALIISLGKSYWENY